MGDERLTSTPPEARVAREYMAGLTAALGLLLGAMTDWFAIAGVLWWVHEGKLDATIGLPAVGAFASGTIVAKMRGGNGGSGAGSTSALLFGLLGTGAFKASVLKGALGRLLF